MIWLVLNLRVCDGGPLVFAAFWGLEVEGESRVGSDEVVAALQQTYPHPPPPSTGPWGTTRAPRDPFIRLTPGPDGQSIRIRHQLARLQRGRAALTFEGTLAEGLRPRLTGTITPDLQAALPVLVPTLFMAIGLIGSTIGLISTAATPDPDRSGLIFLAVWTVLASVIGGTAWRVLAQGCRDLVAALDAALGGWSTTVTAKDGPWRVLAHRRARRTFN
jgi:hypothetical protein